MFELAPDDGDDDPIGQANLRKGGAPDVQRTEEAEIIDRLLHSAINIDQMIMLKAELLLQSIPPDPVSLEVLDRMQDYVVKNAAILREIRSKLQRFGSSEGRR
jgi:hypothetical protein